EIIGREAIDLALIEWRVADFDRNDTVSGGAARIGLDGQARDLGETPAGIGQLRKPVLEAAAQIGAGDLDAEDAIVERQFGEDIAGGQRGPGRVAPAARNPAAIRHRRIGVGGRAHRDTRLPMAASRVRTVAVRLSSTTAVVPSAASISLLSSPSYFATTAAT